MYNSDYLNSYYNNDDSYYNYSRYRSSNNKNKKANKNISKTIIFKPKIEIQSLKTNVTTDSSKQTITFNPNMIDDTLKSNYIFLDERIKLGKDTNILYEFKEYYNKKNNNKYTLINILTSSNIYLDFIKWILTTHIKNIKEVFIDYLKESNDKFLDQSKSEFDNLNISNKLFNKFTNIKRFTNLIKLSQEKILKDKINTNITKFIEEHKLKTNNIVKLYQKILNLLIEYKFSIVLFNIFYKNKRDENLIESVKTDIKNKWATLDNLISNNKNTLGNNIEVFDKLDTHIINFMNRSLNKDTISILTTILNDVNKIFNNIIDIIKNILLSNENMTESTYSKNLINNYNNSIKIYTDIFFKPETILTYKKTKYTILSTVIDKKKQLNEIEKHIKSIKSKKAFIDNNITVTLIPEEEDKWKSYSSDCKSQRTRINNIFKELLKNTSTKLGINIDTNLNPFTRFDSDKDAWNKIYNRININPIDKNINDIKSLRTRIYKLRDTSNNLYEKMRRKINNLLLVSKNERNLYKSLNQILNTIKKINRKEDTDIINLDKAFSLLEYTNDKQLLKKKINIYEKSINNLKFYEKNLEKLTEKIIK